MYLTYPKYKELGGTLEENAFKILEFEARKKIDKLTFGRLKQLGQQEEEVEQCIFKLIDLLQNTKTGIDSESVDGYSVSYSVNTDKQMVETIKDYLSDLQVDGIPYLYVGV